MKKLTLKATSRKDQKTDKTFKKISGILYGPEVKESKRVWVDAQQFKKIFEEAGESTLFDLEIEGEKESQSVLIYDVQNHPVTGKYRHVDFYKVKKGKKIETSVELEFIGESPAVKEKGGILIKNLDSVEIRCLPKDLLGKIKIDLGILKEIDDTVHIGELDIPKEVELLADPKTVIISVGAPRSQEEIDQLDEKVEMDIDQVEGMTDADETETETEKGSDDEKKIDSKEDKKD
ncbi:MAG: 50S ribosomal protein L25 [Patescibacteria group bacterium]|jgi:large subunit ribosomal protein L25|nr:50S ribosomal protein L25 [Patescibacteria group bacterium]